jgi:hypothetical protein
MMKLNSKIKIILVLSLIFLVGGCSLKVNDVDIGNKISETVIWSRASDWFAGKGRERAREILNKGEEMSENAVNQIYGPAETSKKLTAEDKAKIDGWIIGQGLNEYGDPKDIAYAGGTPLFNEVTGETIDKYEYILTKHSGILKELNINK